MVLEFLAVDNFDFTRKIVKKNLGEKLVETLGVSVKIEFLDKNLTFGIVCIATIFQAVCVEKPSNNGFKGHFAARFSTQHVSCAS